MKIGLITIIIGVISTIYNRKRKIIVLISLELILIGITILFLNTSILLDDFSGILFSIFFFTLGAAESAIGLTFILLFYTTT